MYEIRDVMVEIGKLNTFELIIINQNYLNFGQYIRFGQFQITMLKKIKHFYAE